MTIFTTYRARVTVFRISDLRIYGLLMAILLSAFTASSNEIKISSGKVFFKSVSSFRLQNTGTIRGKVTDSKGVALAGVNVKIDGVTPQTLSTDGEGNYMFTGLRAGDYNVTFTFLGFTTATNKVTLATGQQSLLNVSLSEANTSL